MDEDISWGLWLLGININILFDFEKLSPVSNEAAGIGDGNDDRGPQNTSGGHAEQDGGRTRESTGFGRNEMAQALFLFIPQDHKPPGLKIVS